MRLLIKTASAALLSVLAICAFAMQESNMQVHNFSDPIDALSIGVESDEINLAVSALLETGWTAWEPLFIEKEYDPFSKESNLILFPEPTSHIRIRGETTHYKVNLIRISREPIRYALAARGNMGKPRILSRRQWGADESMTYIDALITQSDESSGKVDNSSYDKTPQRVLNCQEAQRKYPEEFSTAHTTGKDPSGKQYRWPRRYSPEIRQLVVHHTAQKVTGDKRAPVERIRALYEYHTNNRGWGDIGYHYVIDDKGQIYEGRAGGDKVVGGHVYCGNVGTIGIVMLGNFEIEKPTHSQTSSLKWLLAKLANKYQINLDESSVFHGKKMSPIVGHGDLMPTECPGYYVRKTLGTIRKHVIAGDYSAKITYPRTVQKTTKKTTFSKDNLRSIGSTELTGRPGGLLHISLQYTPSNGIQRRGRIANITRSDSTIGIWQDTGGHYARVRKELIAPTSIRSGETETIRLRLQLPRKTGLYTVDIGSVTYIFHSEGRRAPSPKTNPTRQSFSPEYSQNQQTPGYRRTTVPTEYTTSRRVETGTQSRAYTTSVTDGVDKSPTIRIRLSYKGDTATVEGSNSIYTFQKRGLECALLDERQVIDSGVVQIDAGKGANTISSWNRPENRFRGILECRVMFGELVLINELSLEDYMEGISEEPDTEPFEKQRAFAIAARSYAAHYMEDANTKFPGMPYDGSDTGKNFQEYHGYIYERNNPRWARAVRETEGLVLKKLNRIVKAAYFSSDDGRTRSPEENGWKNFPFASVFRSKPDPWCEGDEMRGHGVGMSGCGARGQAEVGTRAEEILEYYYSGTSIDELE